MHAGKAADPAECVLTWELILVKAPIIARSCLVTSPDLHTGDNGMACWHPGLWPIVLLSQLLLTFAVTIITVISTSERLQTCWRDEWKAGTCTHIHRKSGVHFRGSVVNPPPPRTCTRASLALFTFSRSQSRILSRGKSAFDGPAAARWPWLATIWFGPDYKCLAGVVYIEAL